MKTWLIYRREVLSYAASPLSAILGSLFLLAAGYWFSTELIRHNRVDFFPLLLRYVANILLVFVPLLTMRLLAGERQSGSVALLLTSPVDEWSIVLGKFAASLTVIFVYLTLTLPYPVFLTYVGNPDPGPFLAGYLGIALLGAVFCAIGLFASSLTASPIVAAVIGFGLSTFLGVVHRLEGIVGGDLGAFFGGLSFIRPCSHMFAGVIFSHHVVYFLSVTMFFLFATQRMLCSNRWR